jgi:hypothetical protein
MSRDWAKDLGLTEPGQELQEEIETGPVENSFESAQVEQLAKSDLDFLAALAMPTVFRYFFPQIYKTIWGWLLSYVHRTRDFSRLALGLPRGFAKTTFIKIFLLYVILFTNRSFIMICAHSAKKAINILADVMDFLNEPNIKAVFGDWQLGEEKDTQDLVKFGFRGRNIIIMAGTIATIRGINLKHQRPDVMLFDDIQSREDADSETISKALETDLYGTAMKAKSPHGCLFLFLANMYPTKWSLLRRLKADPTWIKFICGALVQNSVTGEIESIWEDLQPKAQLLLEYQSDAASGHPEIFAAEVLNDENAMANNLIDINKIPHWSQTEESALHQGNFILIDPATDKANADAVSIGYFELWDEKPVAREIIDDRLSPGQICEQAIKLALRRGCRLIVIEANAFQYVLCWLMKQYLTQYGVVGVEVVDIYSGQASKNSRILTMFKQLLAGEVLLENSVRAQVFSQIIPFNPIKTNNTDGILDLLCYAPRVVQMYGEYILSALTLEQQEFAALEVQSEAVTSPF